MSDKSVDACGLFRFWRNGNEPVWVNPDPPKAGEPCLPFHVVASSGNHIPISALVFARSAVHAKARVLAAIRACVDGSAAYHATREGAEYGNYGSRLLAEIESGEVSVVAKPYDTDLLAASVNWASNGGVSF